MHFCSSGADEGSNLPSGRPMWSLPPRGRAVGSDILYPVLQLKYSGEIHLIKYQSYHLVTLLLCSKIQTLSLWTTWEGYGIHCHRLDLKVGVEGASQLDFWETSQVACNSRECEAEPCPVWVRIANVAAVRLIRVTSSLQPGGGAQGGAASIVGAAASTRNLHRPLGPVH